jgi:hypothetical protein
MKPPFLRTLKKSVQFIRSNWKPLLGLVAITATIFTASSLHIESIREKELNEVVNQFGFDPTEYAQSLFKNMPRLLAGGEDAKNNLEEVINEWNEKVTTAMHARGETDQEAFLADIKKATEESGAHVQKYKSMYSLLRFILVFLVIALSLVLATSKVNLPYSIKKAVILIPMLLAEFAWIFLLTFSWVTILGLILLLFPGYRPLGAILFIVGFVLQIIRGPRFAFASVYLAESNGIVKSATQSYEKTRGRWWSIFGHIMLLNVIMFGSYIFIAITLFFASGEFALLAQFISELVYVFLSVILIGYIVELCHSFGKN